MMRISVAKDAARRLQFFGHARLPASENGASGETTMLDLHYCDLVEVGRRLHAREISPVELTEAMLRRIGKLDRKLHAFARVTGDLARRQAEKAEAELARGQRPDRITGTHVLALGPERALYATAGISQDRVV